MFVELWNPARKVHIIYLGGLIRKVTMMRFANNIIFRSPTIQYEGTLLGYPKTHVPTKFVFGNIFGFQNFLFSDTAMECNHLAFSPGRHGGELHRQRCEAEGQHRGLLQHNGLSGAPPSRHPADLLHPVVLVHPLPQHLFKPSNSPCRYTNHQAASLPDPFSRVHIIFATTLRCKTSRH
jgi:hypothetical protein